MDKDTRSVGQMPNYKQAPGLFAVAVVALAIVSVVSVVGMLYLATLGVEVPQGVNIIVGVALGALAGMVAPRGKED